MQTMRSLSLSPLIVASVLTVSLLAGCATAVSGSGRLAGLGPSSTADPSGTGSPSGSTAAPSAGPISFRDCTSQIAPQLRGPIVAQLQFGCGSIAVPLDYANPGGDKITLEMLKVHLRSQTASERIGSLVVNPGGPGGSGYDAAAGLALQVDPNLLKSFDLVGFDPRGVGSSTPITCISAKTKDAQLNLDYDIRVPADFAAAKRDAADIAAGCTAKYGADLQFYNTVNTARDMDLIRQGLGDDKLNYLGFSYGTELGATYAHLFPTRIRVAVLDGAVDPTLEGTAAAQFQLSGFEKAFDQFAADCVTRTACKALGDPRAAVEALEASANASPIPATGDPRKAAGGAVLLAVASALYDQSSWPDLGTALLDAQHGDASGILALDDQYNDRYPNGSYSNIADAGLTIGCNDSTSDPDDATILATATKWAAEYPMFGLNFAAGLFSCQAWQPNRTEVPMPTAAGSAPIVVIGTVHDPATPYSGAQHLADALGTGVLITWDGEGHTAYPKTACIQHLVDEYLVSANPPASGVECPEK